MAHKRVKHTHPIKDERGFSLLELVVSVGVVLALIIVGVLSYNNISGSAKQSATQKAADEVYDKAFSALLDDDAATKPEDVAEEYNKSSKNVVATVDVLPTGGIKVTATLGEDYFAVRETPVSAGSDGNSPIEQPTDGTDETITSNTYKTIMNFQCDSNVDGFLPIVNMPGNGKATLVNMNTNEETVLENIENTTNEKHFSYTTQYPQTVLTQVDMDADVQYKLTVEAEVDSAQSPFNPETSFAIMSLGGVWSPKQDPTKCLTSIDSIGKGIAGINTYRADKLEKVPSTIPSTVTSLKHAFSSSIKFDQDISGWDVSNVEDMNNMFNAAYAFNQDISSWDVSKVRDMSSMFNNAYAFNNGNQPLDWNEKTAKVKNMGRMFASAQAFNQDISGWNVSEVRDMNNMFSNTQDFDNGNQPLDWGEKTANVEKMSLMFYNAAAFNQDISGWNVSNVTNMSNMFYDADAFNQDVNSWNVSNVTDMRFMFYSAEAFNQDISSWDVSNVIYMSDMFDGAKAFNNGGKPLDWNEKTANVTDMSFMFYNAKAFNQDISNWKVPKIAGMPPGFAQNSGIQSNKQYHPQWGVA